MGHKEELETYGGTPYWDRQGKPLAPDKPVLERMIIAAELFADWNYKQVAHTLLHFPSGIVTVSTIWCGGPDMFSNYNDEPDYKPYLFETMTFDESESESVQAIDRFSARWQTESDALEGHAWAVEGIRSIFSQFAVEIEHITSLDFSKKSGEYNKGKS